MKIFWTLYYSLIIVLLVVMGFAIGKLYLSIKANPISVSVQQCDPTRFQVICKEPKK